MKNTNTIKKGQTMEQLAKTIQLNTNTKDKTAICFLGYFTLYNMKSLLVQFENEINDTNFYKYLERPLTHTENKNGFIIKDKVVRNSFKLNNIDEVLNSIDYMFKSYRVALDKESYERVVDNWEDLGLRELKKEAKENKTGINKVIEEFDNINNFNIEMLIDLFEELNVSNKFFNDYFTPTDISKMIATMASKEFNTKRPYINIYDPSCGIGRVLYHTFIELKEKYPNKKINIFGIDLCNRFKVFTESILSLINFNKTFIERGNTLEDKFDFPKMNICVANPPYNKKGIELEFMKHIKKLNCDSYIVLPKNFGFSKKAEPIRKELFDNNLVKAIIGMPSNMFKGTTIATDIYVLKNNYLAEIQELCIENKAIFKQIDKTKDLDEQLKEFAKDIPKEEYKEFDLLKSRNEIHKSIKELYERSNIIPMSA